MYSEGNKCNENYSCAETIQNHIQKITSQSRQNQKQAFVGDFNDKRLREISNEITSLQ